MKPNTITHEAKAQAEKDFVLLTHVLDGNKNAWNRFYQRFQPTIQGAVAAVLSRYGIRAPKEDVDDFVADVWLSFIRQDFRSLRSFDPARGCPLGSWIKLLASRTAIDKLRHRGTLQRYREQHEEVEQPTGEYFRPDVQLETRTQVSLITTAVNELKKKDQYFLNLYLEDPEAAELAKRLGVTIKAVHSRKFKISKKLEQIVVRLQQRQRLTRLADAYHFGAMSQGCQQHAS